MSGQQFSTPLLTFTGLLLPHLLFCSSQSHLTGRQVLKYLCDDDWQYFLLGSPHLRPSSKHQRCARLVEAGNLSKTCNLHTSSPVTSLLSSQETIRLLRDLWRHAVMNKWSWTSGRRSTFSWRSQACLPWRSLHISKAVVTLTTGATSATRGRFWVGMHKTVGMQTSLNTLCVQQPTLQLPSLSIPPSPGDKSDKYKSFHFLQQALLHYLPTRCYISRVHAMTLISIPCIVDELIGETEPSGDASDTIVNESK